MSAYRCKDREIGMAMANLTSAMIRDWAELRLPVNYRLRVVIRDESHDVEATISRYQRSTNTWSSTVFVFANEAEHDEIDRVMDETLRDLACAS